MPHADFRPASLWWYRSKDDAPTADSMAVIEMYLHQCSLGRTLPSDFRKHLLQWLRDLNCPVKISQRRDRHWTIPAYELAHGINPKTLCKRMREMEKIARRLFPSRAPAQRPPITEDEKEAMRLEILNKEDIKAVAQKHGVTPARVGQICRAEIARLRNAFQSEAEAPAPSFDSEAAF
jgi:hypothetical protein